MSVESFKPVATEIEVNMKRTLKFYWTGGAGEVRNWVSEKALSGDAFWHSVGELQGKKVKLTLEEIPRKKLKKVV